MKLSSELFRRGEDALANRAVELEGALEEAADWLDNDLAHAPSTPVSMADRELIERWRAVLDGAAPDMTGSDPVEGATP